MEPMTLEDLTFYWRDKAEEYFEEGEKYMFHRAYETYLFYQDRQQEYEGRAYEEYNNRLEESMEKYYEEEDGLVWWT